MNQIFNMLTRIIMHKMLSRGIDAGIKKASSVSKASKTPPADSDVDDFLNTAPRDPKQP